MVWNNEGGGAIAKFEIGHVVVTPEVLALFSETDQMRSLNAHANRIWGDLSEEDRLANENGLLCGGRIMSVYKNEIGARIYVITEADRSVTTLLIPEHY